MYLNNVVCLVSFFAVVKTVCLAVRKSEAKLFIVHCNCCNCFYRLCFFKDYFQPKEVAQVP